MFRATPQGQYIASKSQSIKPDVVSDVLAGDQIRMLLPSYLGFIDPRSTYLRMVCQVSGGRGTIVPEPKAGGVHSLFRNVVIRDGSNTATLETLEDYNAMCGALKPFTEQSSIDHKRGLFEGVQAIPTSKKSLYYGESADLTGSTSAAPIKTVRSTNKVETYIQLESGLFKGGQIMPVGLMDGLRLQIDTEEASRAMRLISWDGCGSSSLNRIWSVGGDILLSTGLLANAQARTGVAGLNAQYFPVELDRVVDPVTQEGNPFVINDRLYIIEDDFTKEEELGLIIGFFLHSTNKLGVLVVPQRDTTVGLTHAHPVTGSNVFAKREDRVAKQTVIGESDLGNTGTLVLDAPTYTLSDIEMLCETVQPPDAYVSGMMKKAMTEGGVSMDILTTELHRFNQTNAVGITQIQVPTIAHRAKSLVVQPLVSSEYRDFLAQSLSGVPDGARDYQFQFGNHLVPTRKASLLRYSQTPARVEPLHATELQKALINISRPVFSLQNIDGHFSIARAFNRYGQITDLGDETISLRVDYDSGASLKIFNNYVFKLARIVISKGAVMIES